MRQLLVPAQRGNVTVIILIVILIQGQKQLFKNCTLSRKRNFRKARSRLVLNTPK